MKLPKKLLWILIPLLVLILLFFVQHIMYEMHAPGRLKPAWMIPKADQSDAGQTVSICFADLLNGAVSDSYGNPFVYVYDPDKGINLLAFFQAFTSDASIAQITFYQPEWEGIAQMENFLDKPFNAKIVRRTNIDFMESVYISNCSYLNTEERQENLRNEIIRLPFDRDFSETQYYFGKVDRRNDPEDFWITVGDGLQMGLHGGTLDNCSDTFSNHVAVFMRIIDRFDLREKLGL